MPPKISTLVKSRWLTTRQRVIAVLFDSIDYAILLLGVVIVYRLGILALAYVDPDLTAPVRYMERGANLSILASFFCRLALRAIKDEP